MRVLLTGASSFTGSWFARKLAEAGHEVIAPMRAARQDDPLRQARLDFAGVRLVPGAPFGSEAFLDLINAEGPFDVLAHHAADTTNYKSPDYDVDAAVAANTRNVRQVLEAMPGARMVLTGSAFEAGEGQGTEPRIAFSPYGESKGITAAIVADVAELTGNPFVKFVVPNPFGPMEGPTFQRLVMERWARGEGVHVSHPLYVRDNVPVDLLALAYVAAVEGRMGAHVSPSFYAGPVGEFFQRMAHEVRARTGRACDLTVAETQESKEPLARTNLTRLDPAAFGWSEAAFWDAYATAY